MTRLAYAIKYQLSDHPSPRRHRTLSGLARDLQSARRAARRGGDEQGIWAVRLEDGYPTSLTPDETIEVERMMSA